MSFQKKTVHTFFVIIFLDRLTLAFPFNLEHVNDKLCVVLMFPKERKKTLVHTAHAAQVEREQPLNTIWSRIQTNGQHLHYIMA